MSGATFFGEVTGLRSRGVWWSDDEDEDEAVEDKPQESGLLTWSQMPDLIGCSKLYVTADESFPDVESLASATVEDGQGKKVFMANVYPVDDESQWIVVKQNAALQQQSLVVESVHSLVSTLLTKGKPVIVLLHKASDESETTRCLTNTSVLPFPESYVKSRVLPPSIVDNPVEAAILEICTAKQVPCVLFFVSDVELHRDTFPARILESVLKHKQYLTAPSNIFS